MLQHTIKLKVIRNCSVILLICSVISAERLLNSAQERQTLVKLRPLVREVLYKDYMKEDIYLISWLRVYSSDPVKTSQAIIKAHQWRKNVDIENVVKEDFSKFERDFPLIFDGHDREGRPLVIMPFGLWNVRKIVLAGETVRYQLYLSRMMELLSQKALKTFNMTVPTATGKRDIVDWVILHDLQGYNNRQHGCLACIPTIYTYAMEGENYYGNYVDKLYIVNMPRIFETIIKVILNFLEPATREAIKAFGYDKQEFTVALLKDFESDQLPQAYGGTKA